jgi:hypothetical protein
MDDLLSEIDAFISAHRLTDAKFGRLAANDTWLLKDMKEKGREPRRKTVGKIRHFMATYRSPDAPELAQAS